MIEIDVTDEQSVKQAADSIGDTRLDVLINCAGMRDHFDSDLKWALG